MKDRIKNFIEAKGISAGELAAVVDVQRSNISHILNGRNKPGASFIEKLLLEFPDLNARWLLTGEGDMFGGQASVNNNPQQRLPITEEPIKEQPMEKKSIEKNLVQEKSIEKPAMASNSEIDKMVIMYRDGTFNIYKQR
ncbi:helix-turn-helix domain-containing protein [Draconibacterium halophilum]|uniref:Helix-turn-helix transcriptional regulator n=1 Tax=Draconibacterium halophilum TaxID=2706887 RepID=A0A6C0RGL9_9BACT|nr:helix-turn-helix transcriptional regulator [Draconibacterium halophilum]QIA08221.1 helix-turn-helix transcriptional regulator [Draconibacterium halophilum]